MRSISKLFLLFQLFFLASLTGAFQTGSKIVAGSTNYERRKTSGNLVQSASFVKRSSSMVVLDAKKKVSANEEEERVKKSPLELVLVYMTPWRNPNSIFVYMFMILYALGKYSEARHLENF